MTVLGELHLGTIEEWAIELDVAESTLREWCRRGRFPHIKLPGTRRILIPRRDAEAYLAGCSLETRRLADGGRIVQPAANGKRRPA